MPLPSGFSGGGLLCLPAGRRTLIQFDSLWGKGVRGKSGVKPLWGAEKKVSIFSSSPWGEREALNSPFSAACGWGGSATLITMDVRGVLREGSSLFFFKGEIETHHIDETSLLELGTKRGTRTILLMMTSSLFTHAIVLVLSPDSCAFNSHLKHYINIGDFMYLIYSDCIVLTEQFTKSQTKSNHSHVTGEKF